MPSHRNPQIGSFPGYAAFEIDAFCNVISGLVVQFAKARPSSIQDRAG